jgi:hypothetical protein
VISSRSTLLMGSSHGAPALALVGVFIVAMLGADAYTVGCTAISATSDLAELGRSARALVTYPMISG